MAHLSYKIFLILPLLGTIAGVIADDPHDVKARRDDVDGALDLNLNDEKPTQVPGNVPRDKTEVLDLPNTPPTAYSYLYPTAATPPGRKRRGALVATPATIPDAFDARKHWPKCKSIGQVWNQGACGSCWAVVAASVLTDRFCIASGQETNDFISANQLASCGSKEKDGKRVKSCAKGGEPRTAYGVAQTYGVATGGRYGSKAGCVPYTINAWQFIGQSLTCERECTNPALRMSRDKLAIDAYWEEPGTLVKKNNIPALVEFMKRDIMTNGPITATIVADFNFWLKGFTPGTTGVYNEPYGGKTEGDDLHEVRILGWDNAKNAWLVANTWGTWWGDKTDSGFVWIEMGVNRILIESAVTAPVINAGDLRNPDCKTENFCGATPVDHVIAVDPRDATAPFYLFQGTCVQKVNFIKDQLVTMGIAVPVPWVFPNRGGSSVLSTITYSKYVQGADNLLSLILNFAADNSAGTYDRAADNKFKRQPLPVYKFDAYHPHTVYVDETKALNTLSYSNIDKTHLIHYKQNASKSLVAQGSPIAIDNLVSSQFDVVTGFVRQSAMKTAVFGQKAGKSVSKYLTHTADLKDFKLSANSGILTCRAPTAYNA